MSLYKAGDELRIRQWDDMETEFGTDTFGGIRCPEASFSIDMKHLCGENFTVQRRFDNRYYSQEGIERTNYGCWYIVEKMLEPRSEDLLFVATDKEFLELIE